MGARARRATRSNKEKKPQSIVATNARIKAITQDTAAEKAEEGYAYFNVGKEFFAFALDNVVEALHVFEIEPVPHLPGMYVGVLDLRGESIPVIDLRRIFNEEMTVTEQRTCVITTIDSSMYGFIVDSDIEIVTLGIDKKHPLPDLYTNEEARFIEGVLWVDDKFIGILNPKAVLETFAQWREDAEE